MRRFKLANGGVIASCKQPLQNIDFDRFVINSHRGLKSVYSLDDNDIVSFNISLYNPSTHFILTSYRTPITISSERIGIANTYGSGKNSCILSRGKSKEGGWIRTNNGVVGTNIVILEDLELGITRTFNIVGLKIQSRNTHTQLPLWSSTLRYEGLDYDYDEYWLSYFLYKWRRYQAGANVLKPKMIEKITRNGVDPSNGSYISRTEIFEACRIQIIN